MTLDQQLRDATRHVADGVTPPEVDLGAIRSRARANRRLTTLIIPAVVTAVVVAVIAIGSAVGPDRDNSAPVPPAGPHPSAAPTTPAEPINLDLPAWIAQQPVGAPPDTPYWHDGVLHVHGVEIETPFHVSNIEVAGDTVMVGGEPSDLGGLKHWALLKGDTLEPLPAPETYYPSLSVDGRIASWLTNPTPSTTRFVAWDTETNKEIASRTVPAVQGDDGSPRVQMLGIGADGIAFWIDETSDSPITRWDVRNDTVELTDLTYDFSKPAADQMPPLAEVSVGLEGAYRSPDGTKEVFTDGATGDSPKDCCRTQLRARPLGSVEPSDIITLPLPKGIPSMHLWDGETDRGTWGVWWETNRTVLLDAFAGGHSYLVRCFTSSRSCEVVFDLGDNTSRGVTYFPDWEKDWAFGRAPVNG